MNAPRLLAVAALLVLAGCRQHRYFVDLDRATWGTEAGKKATERLQRDAENKKRELASAADVAKKSEAAGLPSAVQDRAFVNDTAARLEREFNQSRDGERARLVAGLRAALIRVAADRNVEIIEAAGAAAFVDPSVDVTEELIRRANETARASEVETLRAENERLKAAKGKP